MAKVLTPKAASRSAKPPKLGPKKRGTANTVAKVKSDRKSAPIAQSSGRTVKQRAGSKQEQVLQMLAKKAGATIGAIMTATGWQAHSVRGFFAGVVRKKLKLELTSAVADRGRVYRVTNDISSITRATESPFKAAA